MKTLVNCINLHKSYMTKKALSNFTFQFEAGKIYGLLGPNGSGKTTLMKIIADLHKQNSGELTVVGEKPSHLTRQHVAYMPTENFVFSYMSVNDAIVFYDEMYGDFDKEKAYELMSFMELDLKQKVSALSTGQKARLKISLTLSRVASVYLLDEPLNGLDPISRNKIKDVILERFREEATLILSTHLVNEIEHVFDEVIFLSKGEIALFGKTDDLRFEHGKSIEEIYREVFKHD